MPEIPDLTVYQRALDHRVSGARLLGMRIASPFVLRTADPAPAAFQGKKLLRTKRLGKRLVLGFEDDCFALVHLMIAGRLRWIAAGKKLPAKLGLMSFDFETGSLLLTEASQKHRASVHLVSSRADLEAFNPGGIDVASASLEGFRQALGRENHTLKRALTDQRFLSGIGNAYSDEILHRARLSPMKLTLRLDDQEWQNLFHASQTVLQEWTTRLCVAAADDFPAKVTAFQPGMAVHGKYKQPCPDCGKPVQRIRYASNECNYCALCQNQGNLLADRSLSRLLKKDWPKTLEELEKRG